MLGCGPGQLASDMHMLGIDPDLARPRMVEALDVIIRLLRGEVVTEETEWFTLRDARLQLTPRSGENFEVAVTGVGSPNGARCAGHHGIGLLSMGATTPDGFAHLRGHWAEYEKSAADQGHVADRRVWRCVGPFHLADTREQARAEVAHGLVPFVKYFNNIVPGGLLLGDTLEEILAANDEAKWLTIGTPQDAIQRIQEMKDESGGFGTLLYMATEIADLSASRRSLEMFARDVIPCFDGSADAPVRSYQWVNEMGHQFAANKRGGDGPSRPCHAGPSELGAHDIRPRRPVPERAARRPHDLDQRRSISGSRSPSGPPTMRLAI